MIVTEWTRKAFPIMRYAKELRSTGDAEPWRKLEERFGRDTVNFVGMVMTYKRRFRKMRQVGI